MRSKKVFRQKPFVVDNQRYETWLTAKYADAVELRLTVRADFGSHSICIFSGLQNFDYYHNYGHWEEIDSIAITPQMICALIRYARRSGWEPDTSKSNRQIDLCNQDARQLLEKYNPRIDTTSETKTNYEAARIATNQAVIGSCSSKKFQINNEAENRPLHSLAGNGYRERKSGVREPIEEAQMVFYSDGRISGSFVCRIPESNGILWLFNDGNIVEGKIRFDMVHIELRFPRAPVATFSGDHHGGGTYSGNWTSPFGECGKWMLTLSDTIEPHMPGPHWFGEPDNAR